MCNDNADVMKTNNPLAYARKSYTFDQENQFSIEDSSSLDKAPHLAIQRLHSAKTRVLSDEHY